ncbi:MAG: DNA replication protein [Rhodospirillales bacterium]|nr:DNA replication protein [Rhodospirillales bacterium]MCB9996942.1 DNA replication protein [Rhodospirillales bacterium]
MGIAAEQLPLDLGHRPAQGREDFMVAPSNHDAVAWIDRWPDWPAPALILYGPVASGKSHLASVWAVKTNAVLVNNRCLSHTDADELAALGKYLVIDNVDLWLGDRNVETTLFHLYNLMREEGRTMLLTMHMAPTHTEFIIPDLASRLRAAPAAAIQPPDDTLLAALLVKLFADRQLMIGSDVLNYLVPRMERSFAAAYELVRAADRLALSEKRPISVSLIRRILLEQHESDPLFTDQAAGS